MSLVYQWQEYFKSYRNNRMVVHLIPHIGIGGDVVVAKAMVRAFEGTGERILVNGLTPTDAFGGTVPNPLPLNEGAAGFRTAWSRRALVPRDTKVIHAHSPVCLAFALLLRRFRCRAAKVIFTFHWPVPDSGLRRSLKGALFRMADLVHLYSVETVDVMRSRYRVPEGRQRLMYLGLPPDRFASQDPEEARRVLLTLLGIPATARVVGYLGRLATEKNVDYLIRFMEERDSADTNLHLIVAGGGALEQDLRERAAHSSVSESIHFTGYSREPERIYPAFDLLVLPSDFEAFPLVVIEAAYCGVPSLRSDVEGSRDQIVEGVTGFTYPSAQGYEGMRRALSKLLDERWGDLPEVGRAARTHCLQLCDMGRFTEGLAEMYGTAAAQT